MLSHATVGARLNRRKRPILRNLISGNENYSCSPKTPENSMEQVWSRCANFELIPSPEALPSYFLLHNFGEAEDPENDLLTDQELLKLNGPNRLIAFLADLAMNEKAGRALHWTGNGLEFVIVNTKLVSKLWGNRKRNTKDMNYSKLSRAMRDKYKSATSGGQLEKRPGLHTYAFTIQAYNALKNHTGKNIEDLTMFAKNVGRKRREVLTG
ncbi:ETS domain-containing protein [Caenorhabditis elegans]|uniref:ETS domain-containing protein n=1 Tax=Caenorhabditis elegans TaxID=6239 RepID=A0A4V0IJZ6_CAEEL|nr:ETS domain-containing protein [Caenorhabditis elegans]VTW47452.1 ETS domain-containing protein [Caenorhabditis elegans]